MTGSTNFPVTTGAYKTTHGADGGNRDGFVTKPQHVRRRVSTPRSSAAPATTAPRASRWGRPGRST